VAARFGCSVPAKMFPSSDGGKAAYPGYESTSQKLHPRPPVSEVDAKIGLQGGFQQSEVTCQIDLVKWAKKLEVVKAWESLRDKHELDQGAWDNATWEFLTFLIGRNYSCVASMSKARKMGWTGYRDTWDEFDKAFNDLEEAKILPPRH
jgi:hypothetical protein